MTAKKLKRHSLVTIDGQVCQLTATPRKAINGTWYLSFRTAVGGKPQSTYATQAELDEITESKRIGIA